MKGSKVQGSTVTTITYNPSTNWIAAVHATGCSDLTRELNNVDVSKDSVHESAQAAVDNFVEELGDIGYDASDIHVYPCANKVQEADTSVEANDEAETVEDDSRFERNCRNGCGHKVDDREAHNFHNDGSVSHISCPCDHGIVDYCEVCDTDEARDEAIENEAIEYEYNNAGTGSETDNIGRTVIVTAFASEGDAVITGIETDEGEFAHYTAAFHSYDDDSSTPIEVGADEIEFVNAGTGNDTDNVVTDPVTGAAFRPDIAAAMTAGAAVGQKIRAETIGAFVDSLATFAADILAQEAIQADAKFAEAIAQLEQQLAIDNADAEAFHAKYSNAGDDSDTDTVEVWCPECEADVTNGMAHMPYCQIGSSPRELDPRTDAVGPILAARAEGAFIMVDADAEVFAAIQAEDDKFENAGSGSATDNVGPNARSAELVDGGVILKTTCGKCGMDTEAKAGENGIFGSQADFCDGCGESFGDEIDWDVVPVSCRFCNEGVRHIHAGADDNEQPAVAATSPECDCLREGCPGCDDENDSVPDWSQQDYDYYRNAGTGSDSDNVHDHDSSIAIPYGFRKDGETKSAFRQRFLAANAQRLAVAEEAFDTPVCEACHHEAHEGESCGTQISSFGSCACYELSQDAEGS